VDLEVHPEMDIPELPEIGVVLNLSQEIESMSWLGEGPGESLPGKQAASRFGWWNAEIGSEDLQGTRSGLEWVELHHKDGASIQIKDMDGVRIETSNGQSRLRILTNLGGAWTKNGPPERPDWHLNLEPGKSFRGTFTIQ
jgi:beta-galactosidase